MTLRALLVTALACACAEVPVDEQCSVDEDCGLTEQCDWGRCIDRCSGNTRSSASSTLECLDDRDRDCPCDKQCNTILGICEPICQEFDDGFSCRCVIDADCERGTCDLETKTCE